MNQPDPGETSLTNPQDVLADPCLLGGRTPGDIEL